MSSLFGTLEISKRLLIASQLGVRIANHNITNMNSPGFARQELVLSPSNPLGRAFGQIGTGVRVEQVRRVTDDFLTRALRQEESEHSEWLEAKDILGRIEMVMSIDEGTSLSTAITEFFNAFGDLATNPEDSALRGIVVNKAVGMVGSFKELSQQLDHVYQDINEKMNSQVDAVNSLLSRIAEVNEKIVADEAGGTPANDLRTQRDGLVKELNGFVSATVKDHPSGAVDIYIGGKNVVHRDTHSRMEGVVENDTFGEVRRIRLGGEFLAPEHIGGSLGAMAETRDKELGSVRTALDTLASSIISKVNALHSQGVAPAGSTVDFFTGSSAIDIDVHELLRENSDYVAASYDGSSGNNALANDIANLAESINGELGEKSFVAFFSDLVGNVGSLAENATSMVEGKELTTSQLMDRLDSVAGVSLDEELTNIAQYQTAYEAAANVVKTVQEMIDTILAMGAS